MLDSLIDNAIKASDSPREISVSACRNNDEVTIVVRDNGCGMDSSTAARVGERVETGKSFRKRGKEGAGMGVYLVRQLAAKNWGEVEFISEPGKGTAANLTFTQLED